MSMSDMGGGSAGEESGRESAAGHSEEPSARRRPSAARRLAGGVAEGLAVEAVEAAVSAWAPEWSQAARFLIPVVGAVVRLGRGRGGRSRG